MPQAGIPTPHSSSDSSPTQSPDSLPPADSSRHSNPVVQMSSSQVQRGRKKSTAKRIRLSSPTASASDTSTNSYHPDDENEEVTFPPSTNLPPPSTTPTPSAPSSVAPTPSVVNRVYIDVVKRKKGKGLYWDHYKQYRDENQKLRAECIHCGKTFAADQRTNGTSNLTGHLGRCVENPANKSKGTQSKIVLEEIVESGQCKVKSWVLNQADSRKSLAEMIILDELPFRQVEKCGFKRFVATTCPTFKVPSRHTVSRDCYKVYLNEKVALHGWLKKNCQRVSLTTDTWTSVQRINYMVVTAHFIDNEWNLQRRILNFCQITSHRGESLARGIDDCLRAWSLDAKLFTITVDNASSNDVMCDTLKAMTVANGSCIYSGHNMHMRCVAHIGNLIVNDGLKLHMTCVEKVRSIVRYVRYSPARLHVFREEAKRLKIEYKRKIVLDVATRWNSTYLMLDVALKYKLVFDRIDTPRGGNDDCLGAITTDEWKKIELLVKFLAEFYKFTKDVSGTSYVTINNVFYHIGHLIEVLNQLMSSDDIDCSSMAIQMKVKCDKYWGSLEKMNMLIFVAIILNLTQKFLMVEKGLGAIHGVEKGKELSQQVKDYTSRLFEQYKVLYMSQRSQDSGTQVSSSSNLHGGGGNTFFEKLFGQLDDDCGSDGEFATSELDAYLIEPRTSGKMTDLLGWWRVNAGRYPILARMARDVLAVPVSTVSSESAFSTGGRTLDDYRSSLNPKTVEGLICAQDWLLGKIRSTSNINNATIDEENMEDEEEEMMKMYHDLEDLNSLLDIEKGPIII